MLSYRFLACVAIAFCSLATVAEAQNKTLHKIVIDAGHGGKDPGALARAHQEKEIVLDVASQLGQMLVDSLGIEVIYTRNSDVFIPLNERAKIANQNKADLFISIHANASVNKQIYGAETYVLGLHRTKDNLEVAKKENAVITMEDDYSNNYQGFDPNDTESYIIFSLMQNLYLEQSITCAAFVQQAMGEIGRKDNGVKQAGFLVLRETSMPSILIELGYLSNKEEEVYVVSTEGRNEMARQIFKAIKQYKSQYDALNQVRLISLPANIDSEEGLVYRIQVATCKEAETREIRGDFGFLKQIVEDERRKYLVGHTSTYDEAKNLLNKVKEQYPDAFIVPFNNGTKIKVKAARKLEK